MCPPLTGCVACGSGAFRSCRASRASAPPDVKGRASRGFGSGAQGALAAVTGRAGSGVADDDLSVVVSSSTVARMKPSQADPISSISSRRVDERNTTLSPPLRALHVLERPRPLDRESGRPSAEGESARRSFPYRVAMLVPEMARRSGSRETTPRARGGRTRGRAGRVSRSAVPNGSARARDVRQPGVCDLRFSRG